MPGKGACEGRNLGTTVLQKPSSFKGSDSVFALAMMTEITRQRQRWVPGMKRKKKRLEKDREGAERAKGVPCRGPGPWEAPGARGRGHASWLSGIWAPTWLLGGKGTCQAPPQSEKAGRAPGQVKATEEEGAVPTGVPAPTPSPTCSLWKGVSQRQRKTSAAQTPGLRRQSTGPTKWAEWTGKGARECWEEPGPTLLHL